LGDIASGDLYPDFVRYFNRHRGIIYGGNSTVKTSAGNNAVPLFKPVYHFTMFFGLFLLRPNKQKIEYNEHQNNWDE
jgi:hypothetical protein